EPHGPSFREDGPCQRVNPRGRRFTTGLNVTEERQDVTTGSRPCQYQAGSRKGDVREPPLPAEREKCFLLTSPFIEPANLNVAAPIKSSPATSACARWLRCPPAPLLSDWRKTLVLPRFRAPGGARSVPRFPHPASRFVDSAYANHSL